MEKLLNQVPDISEQFRDMHNEYFLPGRVISSSKNGSARLEWIKHKKRLEWAFNKLGSKLEQDGGKEIPQEDYDINPISPFKISQIGSRTVRLQMSLDQSLSESDNESLMLVSNWKDRFEKDQEPPMLRAELINNENWEIEIKDCDNNVLTKSISLCDQKGLHNKYTPTCFIRQAKDYSKYYAFSFSLDVDEKIYGCGESFTGLNKRGQCLNLTVTDAQSAETRDMYKPIPFFISSKGYGVFVHSSASMTFDFGFEYNSVGTLYVADEEVDIFFFGGSVPEIISQYTLLTGRSKLPPIWSFGLWFGKFSFKSQNDLLNAATLLRENQVPCDVFHLDAGWFEHGLNCDYQFGPAFPDPHQMIKDLNANNFHLSLWQIPYYTKRNSLYKEVLDKGIFIKNAKGSVPTNDVILDFSNDDTKRWYISKIERLLEMGVSVIKADFGEAAPVLGHYSSGKGGGYEHNLYPLRYANVIYEALGKQNRPEFLIWSRSAWAGSQRYPVHWSGDPEVSSQSMAATLRAGLSLGLSGFTYWSHDIGGFSSEPEPELYLRWVFMGIFSSHSRVHGFPPREPWEFGKSFLDSFRKLINVRYQLLPYFYSESYWSSLHGQPLLRPLFYHYPNDPNCWRIEDQYFCGSELLIAPLFNPKQNSRLVYLPKGSWYDYFTKVKYEGGWVEIKSDNQGVCLVRAGAILPHVHTAQNCQEINWNFITLQIFPSDNSRRREFNLPIGVLKLVVDSNGKTKIIENHSQIEIESNYINHK